VTIVERLLTMGGLLLAQAGGDGGGGANAAGGGGAAGLMMWFPFIFIIVIFYLLIWRPQSKEQSRRQTMLGALKQNDRVVTTGGIYGIVANVHREADQVTLKIDEASNTKIRVTVSSIARVLGDEPANPPPASK